VRRLVLAAAAVVAVSCGGSDEDDADLSDTTVTGVTTSPNADTSDPPDRSAARFPVPIVEGGEIIAEFPGEVTVSYPEAMVQPLIGFYETYALERDGVGGSTNLDGISYQFDQDGDTIEVSVTPEPPNAILLIRVLP